MSRFIFDEHYGDEQALIDALAEADRQPFYRADGRRGAHP